ncbi:MAG: InlB B-repeat-containing protein [Clostridia bacterium]|nr:InlB B-repeat-containing protein [Clostridia bacterium]
MKLFKRTLSLFLAFMMVFTSVSLLASADLGNDGMSWKTTWKYYRQAEVATKDADGNYVKDADGNVITEKVWIPTNRISRGDKIKARLFVETNYAVGVSDHFFFYHQNFLAVDPSALSTGDIQYLIPYNTDPKSEAAIAGLSGGMDYKADPVEIAEGLIYDDGINPPYVDEAEFDKYDWVYLMHSTGTAITYSGDYWQYEIPFVVKDTADGYAGVFTPEGAIKRPYPYDWSIMYLNKQPAGDGGSYDVGLLDAMDYEYNYILGGPNFDYDADLAGASDAELAAAKKTFEEQAEKEALSVKTKVKYNLNGGSIDDATTVADAEGFVGDDLITLPANPTKVVGSGESATELKFLGWERVANKYVADDGTEYYDPYGGIYYVDAATAAEAGNANQAGLIGDLKAQTFGYSDVTLRAVYQSPAKYQQNVYVQNIENDEYTLSTGYSAEIDAIGGDVIKSADYVVPDGFALNTEKSTAQIIVSADKVETLNIYLDRKTYTATFKSGANGTTEVTKTGKYGAALEAPTPAEWVGHTFTAWSPAVPATFDENVGTYTAQYDSAAANIRVKYSYIDKVTGEIVSGTFTKESLTGFNYAIVESVPAEPAANTTYITYDEILNVEHYAFSSATPATGTVAATGADVDVQFKAVNYTATFTDGNPGSVSVAYYDKLATLPEAPDAETGYQFDGWYNGDVKAVAGETVITGDVTFTAKYSKIPRTVTYVYAGAPEGQTAPASYPAYIGDKVVLPGLPEVEGYQIGNWVISGAENGIVGTSDVVVTSTWTKNTYVVSYFSDEACTNLFTTQTYSYGDKLVYPTEKPSKPGYTFDSWSENAGIEVEKDFDIYATFTAIPYEVKVLGQDGVVLDEWTAVYGDRITLGDLPTADEINELYEADYYVFKNWMYNGAAITDGQVIAVKDNVTIEVELEPMDAVIHFNAGGATFANGEEEIDVELKVYDEITSDMYPAVPEYEGHTFQSWDEYPTEMDDIEKTITIQWKKNTYTVKYVNGLTNEVIGTPVTGTFGTELTAPALPTATGYSFAWDIDLETIPAKNEKGETMVNGGTVTVTAVPTAQKFTVKYFVDGAEYTSKEVAYNTPIDSSINPADAVPEGYKFFGWNLTDGATAPGNLGTMPAADVNVYAVLQAKGDTKYTVEIYEEMLEGGYDLVSSTEYFDGTAGKKAPYVVNTNVKGFIYNEADSIVDELVAGDGSTILEIYYDRKTVTVNIGDETYPDTPYGTEIPLPEGPKSDDPGKEFDKWVDEDGKAVSDPYIVPDSDEPIDITPTYKNKFFDVKYVVEGTVIKTVSTEYTKAIDSTVRPATGETPEGYTFLGWNLAEDAKEVGALGTMPASDVTVYAVLEAHTNVKYTVEIYEEKLEGGYELKSSAEFSNGTAGEAAPYTVNENVKGFIYNAAESVLDTPVAGDGSTVLKVYYDRKTVTVNIGDETYPDTPYGTEIPLPEGPESDDPGKEFDKWVDEDGKAVSDPYIVPDSDKPIDITPTYKNKFFDVKYDVDGTVIATVSTEYTTAIGSTVTPTTEQIPAGYNFLGWNLVDGAKEVGELGNMPASDVTVYAVLVEKTTVKYTVEIYEEMLEGGYDLVSSTEYFDGTTGKNAPYVVDTDVEGFIYNEADSIVDELVAGDGSTVLEIYYDRKNIKVAIGNNEPVELPYGSKIDLPDDYDDNDAGTTFDKWVDADGKEVSDPYTVPDSDTVVEIKPSFKNNSFEVKFIDALTGTTKSMTLEYTAKIPNPGTPDVEGFEFLGWFTADGDKYVAGTTTVPNADVTYTAKYQGLTVNYTVNVYLEKLDGSGWEVESTLEDGVAGETAKYTGTFEGFTLDTTNSVTESVIKGDGSTVLNVYFTRNSVKITVDGEEVDVPYGTEITEDDLDAEVEPGYKIEKWTDAEGNEVKFPVAIKGGETFVPVTVKDTFTAKFQLEDGTQIGEDVVAEFEAAITAPEAPEAPEGKTFRGWLDKTTNTYFDGKMPAKNVVYTAFYASNDEATYTVNIYVMNTQGVEELSGSYTATATIGTTQSVVPGTVACCTLDTAKSNTSCVILADNSATINLYFVRGLYTVSFDGVETEVYAGAVIPVPADPTDEGQKFLGWTPAVPVTMPEEDLTFTSTWEPVVYTITYIVNGDEIVHEYTFGETVTAYEVTTAPAGLVFDSWSAEIPATMPAENLVVSAVFKAAAYKVTYLDANGDVFASYPVAYGAELPVPTEVPTKEFHKFVSWSAAPSTMPNHDVTITPVFEAIEVRLIPAEGSSTVIDRENGVIYGLQEILSKQILDEIFLDYEGDGRLVINPVEGSTSRYGTGAVVELYDNADGRLVESYRIVVFGDLNGDSYVNGIDISIASDESFLKTFWSDEADETYAPYKVIAADLDHNGFINTTDVGNIRNYVHGVVDIDQTTGKIIRS